MYLRGLFHPQPEMSLVLYPLFVHLYLEQVYKGLEDEGNIPFISLFLPLLVD